MFSLLSSVGVKSVVSRRRAVKRRWWVEHLVWNRRVTGLSRCLAHVCATVGACGVCLHCHPHHVNVLYAVVYGWPLVRWMLCLPWLTGLSVTIGGCRRDNVTLHLRLLVTYPHSFIIHHSLLTHQSSRDVWVRMAWLCPSTKSAYWSTWAIITVLKCYNQLRLIEIVHTFMAWANTFLQVVNW